MTLPSRERIEELRELAAYRAQMDSEIVLSGAELLSVLDCALVLRRLEEWLRGVTAWEGPELDVLPVLRAALDKAGAP